MTSPSRLASPGTRGELAGRVREVAEVGSATSTTRTAEQTEIARFFGGNLTAQLQAGYRDHISRHQLNAGTTADPGWTSLLLAPPFRTTSALTPW